MNEADGIGGNVRRHCAMLAELGYLAAAPISIAAAAYSRRGDPLVPLEDVTAFKEEMTAAQVDWQAVVHGRARHNFTNVHLDRPGD